VAIAQERQIVQGRRLRVDTTVVATNIHYPTDSSLLGDGVRVLTRTMKRIAKLAGAAGAKLRDRTRAVRYRLVEIGRATRSRTEQGQQRLKQAYEKLLSATGRVVGQAKRFAREVAAGIKRAASILDQALLLASRRYLETMIPRVQQVIGQTRARVLKGNARFAGKIVSLFEPHTEVIRKGKAAKPTEFGKMVKVQEAEQQIITHYDVYDERPSDAELLIPSLEAHRRHRLRHRSPLALARS
jgi:IS5 family transposase